MLFRTALYPMSNFQVEVFMQISKWEINGILKTWNTWWRRCGRACHTRSMLVNHASLCMVLAKKKTLSSMMKQISSLSSGRARKNEDVTQYRPVKKICGRKLLFFGAYKKTSLAVTERTIRFSKTHFTKREKEHRGWTLTPQQCSIQI